MRKSSRPSARRRRPNRRLVALATQRPRIQELVEAEIARRSPAELRKRGVHGEVLTAVLNQPALEAGLKEMARLFPESRPDEALRAVIGEALKHALRQARAAHRRAEPRPVVLRRVK